MKVLLILSWPAPVFWESALEKCVQVSGAGGGGQEGGGCAAQEY